MRPWYAMRVFLWYCCACLVYDVFCGTAVRAWCAMRVLGGTAVRAWCAMRVFGGTAVRAWCAMHVNRVGQNHIYTMYLRYFWQGNHQIYGHVRRIYAVLANPMCEACSAGANSVKCGGGAHKLRGRFFHASCTVTNARSHSKLTRHAPSTTCACSITPPPPPHTHMLTHINTCMHTQAHTHVHTRTHKHTHSLSLSLYLSLSFSHSHSHSHTHTHAHTHIHTHTHNVCTGHAPHGRSCCWFDHPPCCKSFGSVPQVRAVSVCCSKSVCCVCCVCCSECMLCVVVKVYAVCCSESVCCVCCVCCSESVCFVL